MRGLIVLLIGIVVLVNLASSASAEIKTEDTGTVFSYNEPHFLNIIPDWSTDTGWKGVPKVLYLRLKTSFGFELYKIRFPGEWKVEYDTTEVYSGNTFPVNISFHMHDGKGSDEFFQTGGFTFIPMAKYRTVGWDGLGWEETSFCSINKGVNYDYNFKPPIGDETREMEDSAVLISTSDFTKWSCFADSQIYADAIMGIYMNLGPYKGNPVNIVGDLESSREGIASFSPDFALWDKDYQTLTVNATVSPKAQRGMVFYMRLMDPTYFIGMKSSMFAGIDALIKNKVKDLKFTKKWHFDSKEGSIPIHDYGFLTLATFVVNQTATKDLYPVDMRPDTHHPIEGEEFTMTAGVRNYGDLSQNVWIEVYANKTLIENTSFLVGTKKTEGKKVSFNLPEGLYNIKLAVDPSNYIKELDDTNNNMTTQIYVHRKPDLIVTDIDTFPTVSMSGEIREKDRNTIYTKVTNIGDTDADGFVISVYDDGELVEKKHYHSLDVNETDKILLTREWVPDLYGNHNITVIADRYDYINEDNENNNGLSEDIYVNPIPNLRIKSIDPHTLAEGEKSVIDVTVENIRSKKAGKFTLYLRGKGYGGYNDKEFDPTIPREYFIGEVDVNSIDGNSEKIIPVQWTPAQKYGAGEFYITATADYDKDVFEFNEDDNKKTVQTYIMDKDYIFIMKGWNFITLPNIPTQDYVNNPYITAQEFGEDLNDKLADLDIVLIQKWNSTHWVTHLVNETSGLPGFVQKLVDKVKLGPKPNFIINAGEGYRVYAHTTGNNMQLVPYKGYLIEDLILPSSSGWSSMGWYPDSYTRAHKTAKIEGALVVASWDRETQSWRLYVNETVDIPGVGSIDVNSDRVGDFNIQKSNGYLVYIEQELDDVELPVQDELISTAPDIDVNSAKEIVLTVPGVWNYLEDPPTPDFYEPPLISVGPVEVNNWSVIIDWNKIFDGNVSVTKNPLSVVLKLAELTGLRPDIITKNVSFSDNYPKSWEEISISLEVENQGLNTAKDVYANVYKDDYLIGTVHTPYLDPGETKTLSMDWTTAELGDFNIKVEGNPYMDVVETFYQNNFELKPIKVEPIIIPQASVNPGQEWKMEFNTNIKNGKAMIKLNDLPPEFEIDDVWINYAGWDIEIDPLGEWVYVASPYPATWYVEIDLILNISGRTKPGLYNITLIEMLDEYHFHGQEIPILVEQPGSTNPPLAVIESITPGQPHTGESILFTGSGTDPDGSVTGYYWTSSLDGEIGTQQSFSKKLSPGEHVIRLKVEDDSGTWSSVVTDTLFVNQQPAAEMVSISPEIIMKEGWVEFEGKGEDDGEIVDYEWVSDKDGFLSDSKAFSYPYLSKGVHTISFRVKDDSGAWSSPNEANVTVGKAVVYKTTPCTEGDSYFTTIQKAVDAAPEHTWIVVCPGTYQDNVYIDKPVKMKSFSGPEVTIIDALATDQPVVGVDTTEYVHIEGFTIKGADDPYNGIGVGLWNSYFVNATDNIITENTFGAALYMSAANTFWKNHFINNDVHAAMISSGWPNDWNSGYIGNYWDDYSGSGSYWIDFNNEDNSPLWWVSCGDTLTKSKMLINDLIDCPKKGLTLDAAGMTLDCDGHTIDGTMNQQGIRVGYLKDNIKILNCKITEFDRGVSLESVSNKNIVSNNIIEQNKMGISVGTYYNRIENNIIQNNAGGIILFYANHNEIVGNDILSNPNYGVYVQYSEENKLQNNYFYNGNYGVFMQFAEDNRVWDNEFENNNVNAEEDSGSKNNIWDFEQVGNQWDDFSSNTGYPFYYDISGPGDGRDKYPNGKGNFPPEITSSPPLKGTVGKLYTYDMNALDPEGEKLTYKLWFYPPDMEIDADTGLITWNPTYENSGLPAPPGSKPPKEVSGGGVSGPGTGPLTPSTPGSKGNLTTKPSNSVDVKVRALITDGIEPTLHEWTIKVSD
jgi:parallel beta-helix repeat protein